MKIAEIRALGEDELEKEIANCRKTLFDLRFKKASHQLNNPAELRSLRHRVAQLKTVLREKKVGSNQAASTQANVTAGGES